MQPTSRADLSLLVLRLLATPIFVGAGVKHLVASGRVAARLAAAPHADLALALAPARTLVVLSGVALLAGGLALFTGLFTRAAALGLLAVLVPITVTVQLGAETNGPLLKNVAIAGLLLHLALSGAGAFALDALLSRRWRLRAGAAGAAIAAALLLAAGGLAPASTARAAEPPAERRVVLLVQGAQQLDPVLTTAGQMLAGRGLPAREVRVIACGGALEALLRGSPAEGQVAKATAAGVQLVACGLTLEKKGIEPSRLQAGVGVVPNGIVEALRLESEGWLSLAL
ncbi:DoxX family membrane protein [Anaeromyxobacter terrae]|uniref:DoxX family membrane protein n=1 Tax=Anaeromyxobacter terrae TaxID=2925406 RepID=UPI001F578672|nr:DoxX family membrane protein [Anaeromyxobacter sp. SG22]